MSDMARCAKCQMSGRNPDAFPTDVETIGLCYDVRLDPSSDRLREYRCLSTPAAQWAPRVYCLKKWLNDPKT